MTARYVTDGRRTAATIRAHLDQQERTWLEVANKAGVSLHWLYELRHTRGPSVDAVQAVAAVLQVPPWVLLWPESADVEDEAA